MNKRTFIADRTPERTLFCTILGHTLFASYLFVVPGAAILTDHLGSILFFDLETHRGYRFEGRVAALIRNGEEVSVDDVDPGVLRRCVKAVYSIMGNSPISAESIGA